MRHDLRIAGGTATLSECRGTPMRHTRSVVHRRCDTLAMSQRYTAYIAPRLCDTRSVPLAALPVPNTALNPAKAGSEPTSCGTNRAKTGTPYFGYIIAAAPEKTGFVDFFHNQIATAWPAFLNAPFRHASHAPLRATPARPFSAMALAAFLILMTKRLRALLLTAHAE